MFEGVKKAFSSLKEAIITKEITEEELEKHLWDFELKLIENNVTIEVARKLSEDFKKELIGKRIKRTEKIEKVIEETFKNKLEELLENTGNYDLIEKIKSKKSKPFVIVFLGVNGVGKTTAIAKLCYFLKKKNLNCIIACSDTFRAGAIEQLELHAKNLGVEVVKHKYGASPTAVAFDAVQLAYKKGIDVVLIDTAGRMQTDKDLLEEMKKLVRVIQPDAVFLVVDSLTGNDSYKQAEIFAKEVGYDGFILTKVDADEKGGVALSITYETKKPIVFISHGMNYDDLMIAKREWIINKILGYGSD
ncbi:MAG: signal recognition particle-docking protein FtsY [Thermoproteota archaeon]|jgi:fused signal recognition particle receptor|nr:signal recognition particle-docking protein FtsY [Thermoproteota archaeon]